MLSVSVAHWLPWLILAIAVVALVGLAVRFVALYRQMKREKLQRQSASADQDAVLGADGEFFVLYALRPYAVGEGKQLCAGEYIAGNSEPVCVLFNGVAADVSEGDSFRLQDGDVIRAERDLRVKPLSKEQP